MSKKFKNKDGSLNGYAFACGYIQREEKNGKYKEIYMEDNHYHIKNGVIGESFENWEVYSNDELTKARKFYRSIKV